MSGSVVPKVGVYAVWAVVAWLAVYMISMMLLPSAPQNAPSVVYSTLVRYVTPPSYSLTVLAVLLIPLCMMAKRWAFAGTTVLGALVTLGYALLLRESLVAGGFTSVGAPFRIVFGIIMGIVISYLSFRAYQARKAGK